MRSTKLVFCFATLSIAAGCATLRRGAGESYALRGVVQSKDGAPLSDVRVAVSGIDPIPFPVTWVPGPISPSWHELRSVKTDSEGRFAVTVPYYVGYRILAGEPIAIAGIKDDAVNLRSKEIILRANEPNQPPHPTR
jgi:hypothetical protein